MEAVKRLKGRSRDWRKPLTLYSSSQYHAYVEWNKKYRDENSPPQRISAKLQAVGSRWRDSVAEGEKNENTILLTRA
jgi:hypothetical protein